MGFGLTVGEFSSSDFVIVNSDSSRDEALDRFSDSDFHDKPSIYYIFVEENDKLKGVASVKDLMNSESLEEALETDLVSFRPEQELEEAARKMAEYDFQAFPVVENDRMVGVLRLDDVQEKVADMIEEVDSDKLIICSHYPPKKLGDKITSGKRIGFDQFRRMIMKHKPALWVNGHVHEDFGENELMGTKVLNASSFDSGKAYSVTLDDGEVKVEEVELLED